MDKCIYIIYIYFFFLWACVLASLTLEHIYFLDTLVSMV